MIQNGQGIRQWGIENWQKWYGKTQVTSHELRVQIHELRVQIHEFKFMTYELKSTSSNSRVTSSTLRVTSSNPQVTSSNPRVTSSNPRVQESFNLWKLHRVFSKYGIIEKYRVYLRFYLIKIKSILAILGSHKYFLRIIEKLISGRQKLILLEKNDGFSPTHLFA